MLNIERKDYMKKVENVCINFKCVRIKKFLKVYKFKVNKCMKRKCWLKVIWYFLNVGIL